MIFLFLKGSPQDIVLIRGEIRLRKVTLKSSMIHLEIQNIDIILVFPDIIDKWDVLHTLATERQQQSRELVAAYKEVAGLRASLQDVGDELDLMTSFEDVHDLEHCVKDLQVGGLCDRQRHG